MFFALTFLLFFGLPWLSAQSPGMRRERVLKSGWQFREVNSSEPMQVPEWHPAAVPGDVHLDLLRNGLIPSPFYRDNVKRLQWIETADWEYRDTFSVGASLLESRHTDLVFEGLDTDAEVFLNGSLILTANNMFREWSVDVRGRLHSGNNILRVVFPSPIREAGRIASQDSWRNSTHAPTPIKTYLRKAAYEYGWDWGPRLVTSGIWREVRLETWHEARISNLFISQEDIHRDVAHVDAQVEITASSSREATVSVTYAEAASHGFETRRVLLHAGVNKISFPFEISKPDLWYPAGYGSQPLYRFAASVAMNGRDEDSIAVRTGLRSVELRRRRDAWGRSFEFVVNGIPVFAKGASVVPFDSFPERVSEADYRRILEAARDANMNMVRQWGGGYYESDAFYNLCDKLGLMVWQDFMFGNEWQPGTSGFRRNVAAEAAYQIRRLRNHPSIVLWCGNNETEASWKWPRTVAMTLGNPEIARHMWQGYLLLFNGVIGSAVEKYDPAVPFWPSSPSADYEHTSGDFRMPDERNLASPQTYMSGDMHLYGVHAPFDYDKYFPRFMSEYGWLSFPDPATLDEYTRPQDRTSISTPVMLAHQDGENGDQDTLREVRQLYGEPRDLPSLIYLSQVVQAEWVKAGAEHLRRNRPRTMGSLYWQLNDCWPVASLSSIDYYGRWKALQYYAHRFYNPLLISPHVKNGNLSVYVVSDKLKATPASVRLRILRFDGTVLDDRRVNVSIPPASSRIWLNVPMESVARMNQGRLGSIFAVADLIVDRKTASRNVVFFVPWRELDLPHPEIRADLTRDGAAYKLRLISRVFAPDVAIRFGSSDVHLSDDYFDLLPGEARTIGITSPDALARLQSEMKFFSVADALASR